MIELKKHAIDSIQSGTGRLRVEIGLTSKTLIHSRRAHPSTSLRRSFSRLISRALSRRRGTRVEILVGSSSKESSKGLSSKILGLKWRTQARPTRGFPSRGTSLRSETLVDLPRRVPQRPTTHPKLYVARLL